LSTQVDGFFCRYRSSHEYSNDDGANLTSLAKVCFSIRFISVEGVFGVLASLDLKGKRNTYWQVTVPVTFYP